MLGVRKLSIHATRVYSQGLYALSAFCMSLHVVLLPGTTHSHRFWPWAALPEFTCMICKCTFLLL